MDSIIHPPGLQGCDGITQEQLAKRLKQTQSFVSKVERGDRRIDIVQLRTLCKIYGSTLMAFVQKMEAELSRKSSV